MPATKPTNTCEFATTPADPADVQFPSALVAPGYSFQDTLPYVELNGFFNRTGAWTAYLKDLLPNLVFTGAADYGRAQIDPETEVNFGTNATFTRDQDTVSELSLKIAHSGAGFSQFIADRLKALGKLVLGSNSSAQVSVTDYSAPASESNQTVTVENETAVALGETRLEAGGFKPALDEPHVSGTGTPYAKDEALYGGNLLRARWAGKLANSGGSLAATKVNAYNMTFLGTPSGNDEYRWDVTDNANIGADPQVVVTMWDVGLATDPVYLFRPHDIAGLDNFYEGTADEVRLGIAAMKVPLPGDAWAAGDGDTTKVEDTVNVATLSSEVYVTIEVYA